MLKMTIRGRVLLVLVLMWYSSISQVISAPRKDIMLSISFDIGVSRYRDNGEFYRGEPVFVHAGILKKQTDDPEDSFRIGSSITPWYRNIEFKVYKVSNNTDYTTKTVSSIKTLDNMTIMQDVSVDLLRHAHAKQLLKSREREQSSWYISPDATARLPAGIYAIQATYDTTRKPGTEPIKINSSIVIITITKAPDEKMALCDILLAKARLFEYQLKPEEELRCLANALLLDPSRKEIHCRMGRAYEIKGEDANAIREYRIYVDWARQQPKTGKDDRRNHADIIEKTINSLESKVHKK